MFLFTEGAYVEESDRAEASTFSWEYMFHLLEPHREVSTGCRQWVDVGKQMAHVNE